MKRIPRSRGLLVSVLIAVMIITGGLTAAEAKVTDSQTLYDVKVRYLDEIDQSLIYEDIIEDQRAGQLVTAGALEFFGYERSDGKKTVQNFTVTNNPASNVIVFYYTKKDDYVTVSTVYLNGDGEYIDVTKNKAYSVPKGSTVTEAAIHFDHYIPEEPAVQSVIATTPTTIKFLYKHLEADHYNMTANYADGGGGNGGSSDPVSAITPPALNKTDHFAYVVGYPDGEVKPLGAITREEAAAVFYRLMTEDSRKRYYSSSQPFADVAAGRWSNDEIATLYNAKIIQGSRDGTFEPSKPITRDEFAAIASRFDNSSAKKGQIGDHGGGILRPDNIIIRCEAMKMINEELDRRVNTAGLCSGTRQWTDNTQDKWYYEIVLEATNSHDYQREDRPKSTEKWTKIKDNPVW